MRRFLHTLLLLLKKDLLVEFRGREFVVLCGALSLLLAVVISVGISGAFINPDNTRKIFPVLSWVLFVFAATVSISKVIDYEQVGGASTGVLLTGAHPATIYLSKMLAVTILVTPLHVLTTLVLAGLLDIRVDFHLGFFILLSLAVSLAYSALAVLIATMAGSSRLRSMLTPILLLPLLFPLLFAALELTHQIVAKSPIVDPTWLYFLGGLDVLYLLIGSLLFEHVIRE